MYLVQSNHGRTEDFAALPPEEWVVIGSSPASRAYVHRFDNLDRALRALKENADMSRMVWPMRVIDEEGRVYRIYDPEQDTRLPGCKWRMIERAAYALWEAAGTPPDRDVEFWLQAERELPKSDGICEVAEDYTQTCHLTDGL